MNNQISEQKKRLSEALLAVIDETGIAPSKMLHNSAVSIDEIGILSIRNPLLELYGHHYDIDLSIRDQNAAHGALFAVSFGTADDGAAITKLIRKLEGILNLELYDGDVEDGADVSLSFMEFSDSAINPTSFIHRMYELIRREDLKPIIMEILHYSYLEY